MRAKLGNRRAAKASCELIITVSDGVAALSEGRSTLRHYIPAGLRQNYLDERDDKPLFTGSILLPLRCAVLARAHQRATRYVGVISRVKAQS